MNRSTLEGEKVDKPGGAAEGVTVTTRIKLNVRPAGARGGQGEAGKVGLMVSFCCVTDCHKFLVV